MKYITIEQAQEPLNLWHAFAGEERVYWYNPVRKQTIFAAVRADAISVSSADDKAEQVDAFAKEFPYTWLSETFFPTTKTSLWDGMGNEIVAFSYYYKKEGETHHWLIDESQGIGTASELEHRIDTTANNTAYDKEAHDNEILDKAIHDKEKYVASSVSQDNSHFDATQIAPNDKLNSESHQYTMSDEDYGDWCTFFEAIQDTIQSGKAIKIVASRAVALQSDKAFNIVDMLRRLQTYNENSFVFAYAKGDAIFIGATPEILIQKEGTQMLSYALAGTIKKRGAVDEEAGQALLGDAKNCHEHGIVVDMIKSTMSQLSPQVMVEPMGLMELKNLFHLRTIIRADGGDSHILNWIHALHPTPAMGGQPREVALDLLAKKEPHERGLYAAPLGFLETNSSGVVDGTIVVGIRSALVKGHTAYAYAGCGIVGDSDCASEYEETKTKLGTILEVL